MTKPAAEPQKEIPPDPPVLKKVRQIFEFQRLKEEVAFPLERPVDMPALHSAVRSIVSRYHKFTSRIMCDPVFVHATAAASTA
jgi:hypothetical protein